MIGTGCAGTWSCIGGTSRIAGHCPAIWRRIAMLQYTMSAGTTSATTFKIREGSSSGGTVTFNGEDGAAYYGGTLTSTLTIKEICL